MTTIGQALVRGLEARGVEVVFGIPGVHTIELYRGLDGSSIRHVTPRHEQGAGFMADGYARVSGKPGVAFVITGPGLTNTLTPMAQARADSVPMLVVSGVNRRDTLGRGLGCLHELPDQQGLAKTVALSSDQIGSVESVQPILDHAFSVMAQRPGPVYIELPIDVMALPTNTLGSSAIEPAPRSLPDLSRVRDRLETAARPVILAGGGAKYCDATLRHLAEVLDAPVVQTASGRGLMHGHPLVVPASPSLKAVRTLLSGADLVLALGTEISPTDYDVYATGSPPVLPGLIHIDLNASHLSRGSAEAILEADLAAALPAITEPLRPASRNGAARAAATRKAAFAELDMQAPGYCDLVAQLQTLRAAFPGAIMVGDSTQAIYAGNLYYDHDRPGGWFGGATGFGALGYAIPAAIGAAIAAPGTPVLALMGDGGAQFTLPEIGTATDEALPILFVIWNNAAYLEIARAMEDAGFTATGCHPAPPDFAQVAASHGLPFFRTRPAQLATTLAGMPSLIGPAMLEIDLT